MRIKQNNTVSELIEAIKDTAPTEEKRESWLQTLAAFEMFEKEQLQENDRLHEQICNTCKEQLEDILSAEQLGKFEEIFYNVTDSYIFSAKEVKLRKDY